ncbi:MAG: cell division protein SepF [Gammaproteobacteria bacterium]|jgi:FtsZ-interacting cell division protein YlmF
MAEEIEIVEVNAFDELIKLKDAFENTNKVGVDIRNIQDTYIRRRILDFVTGIAFGRGLKVRILNKDGVYLIA